MMTMGINFLSIKLSDLNIVVIIVYCYKYKFFSDSKVCSQLAPIFFIYIVLLNIKLICGELGFLLWSRHHSFEY